jgi:sucrose-6-phosphate hydrolase SacC (GH32 family)
MDMKDLRSYRLLCSMGLISICFIFAHKLPGQDSQKKVLQRQIKIEQGNTYLNLPVNSADRMVRATIKLDGTPLDRFTINLAEEKPEFWTFFDVTDYQGKTLTIEIADAPGRFPGQNTLEAGTSDEVPFLEAKGLTLIFADSKFPGQDSLYRESGRPQVHFSAQRGWINDPNGLVYDDGEYHLYFQHNPYGWQWGNMHWGHAVSKDLMHWQQLEEAIYPVIDENESGRGDAAFSGSAVVDPKNTAGFRKDGIDPIIAIYTSTGRGECLKMSYDQGRSFMDYEGNPILVHNGRDPKVFWYEPGNHWVMVVWNAGMAKKISLGQEVSLRQHSIYTSPDLKNWTYQSGVSGFYECPELFELPVEGEPGVSKWVMYDAHGRYVVGHFDGKEFGIEQHFTRYEHGGGYFYASQTFNNSPDGRRIQIGWGRNITHPGMPFNQAQLFPTELRLRRTLNGYRLCPTPIGEIKALHKNTQVLSDKVIQSGQSEGISVNENHPVHVLAEFERGDAPIILNILGYELRHDNEWTFATTAPDEDAGGTVVPAGPFPPPSATTPVIYVPNSEIFKIEAIVDKNILEFFINDGELYYVTAFNGKKTSRVEASVAAGRGRGSRFSGPNRKIILKKLEVSELNSIWISHSSN